MLKKHRVTSTFILVCILSACSIRMHGEIRPGFEQQWKDFRAAYPYHMQVVAVSQPDTDRHRLLIISEPPPHVTLDELQQLSPFLQAVDVKKNLIGYDGWTKDLLFDLPEISEPDLRDLIDALHNYLFYTSYKADVVDLPVQNASPQKYALDFSVSASDLENWLFPAEKPPSISYKAEVFVIFVSCLLGALCAGLLYRFQLRKWIALLRRPFHLRLISFGTGSAATILFIVVYHLVPKAVPVDRHSFVSVLGGDPLLANQILSQGHSGVFFSYQPGLVLWSLNRSEGVADQQIQFREFALDSDLLLGAVSNGDQLVIVGRERQAPLDVLPPLRTETMLVLASADTDELAQSYSRTHLFAGRFDGVHDWAPIYLSNELVDTEYGSLLNITDQILKSWSLGGRIKYARFEYPEPSEFPSFAPLNEWAKTRKVTFNWNTKGAGYVLRQADVEIYALNRTGALPVDYLGGDDAQLEKAEDIGYEYFSSRCDPNLVRVVQYAALYQIFRRFKVTAPASSTLHQQIVPRSFGAPVTEVLNWLMSLNEQQVQHLASKLRSKGFQDEAISQVHGLLDLKSLVYQLKVQGGTNALKELSDALAGPEIWLGQMQLSGSVDKLAHQVWDLSKQIAASNQIIQISLNLGLNSIKDAYVVEGTRNDHAWIRTPSIVVSWPVSDSTAQLIGGHNLSARVTVFDLDPSLGPREIKVDESGGQKIIHSSPTDSDKIPDLVREAGRNREKPAGELAAILRSTNPHTSLRSRNIFQLPHLNGRNVETELRGFTPRQSPQGLREIGWLPASSALTTQQNAYLRAFTDSSTPAVLVSRQPDGGFLVAHSSSHDVLKASNLPAAVSAARSCINDNSGSSDVGLYLVGFGDRQGRTFAQSFDLQTQSEKGPNISLAIESTPLRPDELREILNQKYQYERAEVEHISESRIESDGRATVDVQMKVPVEDDPNAPLEVNMELSFTKEVHTRPGLINAIRAAISRFLQAVAAAVDRVHLLRARRTLIRELKKVDPNIRIHFKYKVKGKDLYANNRFEQIAGISERNSG